MDTYDYTRVYLQLLEFLYVSILRIIRDESFFNKINAKDFDKIEITLKLTQT